MKLNASIAAILSGLLCLGVFAAISQAQEAFNRPYAHVTSVYHAPIVATTTPGSVRVPILIYHTVHPTHSGETLAQIRYNVTPQVFEKQLMYLQDRGYTTISLDQLVSDIQTGTTTVAKPVVLTFDDGWVDQYTTVLPLLKKYGDSAIFYVYTNPISKDKRFMTWDEVRALHEAGMTIGSHTLSHPYLSKLTPDQLRREVVDSKHVLEERLGIEVKDFASPFGYSNDAVVALLNEAGYATGRTTYKGTTHSENDVLKLTGYFAPQTMHDFEWILAFAP